MKKGLALSVSCRLVACACNNGIVKLFTISSLQNAGTLHFTSAKRFNKANTVDCHEHLNQSKVQPMPPVPDAIACQFSTSEKLGKYLIISLKQFFFSMHTALNFFCFYSCDI